MRTAGFAETIDNGNNSHEYWRSFYCHTLYSNSGILYFMHTAQTLPFCCTSMPMPIWPMGNHNKWSQLLHAPVITIDPMQPVRP